MIYYILLAVSILLETVGVFFLNQSDGFTAFIPTIVAVFFYCSSIAIYIILTKGREVGNMNAVFAGVGTVLVVVFGILLLNESVSLIKMLGIGLIIFGAVSVNLKPSPEGSHS